MDEKNSLKRFPLATSICCARKYCDFCVVLAVLTCPCVTTYFFAYGVLCLDSCDTINVWEMWLTSCICQYSHTFLYPLYKYNFVGRDRLASKKSNLTTTTITKNTLTYGNLSRIKSQKKYSSQNLKRICTLFLVISFHPSTEHNKRKSKKSLDRYCW